MPHLAGHKIPVGVTHSTVMPDFDFETYSDAGYSFDEALNKWVSIVKSPPHGLGAVGAPAYSEHHSTEVLCMAYDLKEGVGKRIWVPGMPSPQDLFDHIKNGGLLEACNSAFEYYIWLNVCVPRMGWPELPFEQLRCVASKARAHALPGALGEMAKALEVEELKIEDGKRLIKKLCRPRQPTKKDSRRRVLATDPQDYEEYGKIYNYCLGDISSEAAVSAMIPDLDPTELELWLLDQKINFGGMQIDVEGVKNCMAIVNEVVPYYNAELETVTGGDIKTVSQNTALVKWLATQGVVTKSVDADHVEELLERDDLSPPARRALEIKQLIGSSSVKKLFAIDRRISSDGRIRDIFAYCGAGTGRWAGRGPQPQNLFNGGPDVKKCKHCNTWFRTDSETCVNCGVVVSGGEYTGWGPEAADQALQVIAKGDINLIKRYYGDVITAICGGLRSLFCAAEGKDLICSDYSAIEAVVIAMLAGEQWRIDVFRTHGKIYEMSAAKITGVSFDEMIQHKKATGEHHYLRKSIGKVAELACFTHDTQLLTDRGYVSIVDIKVTDKLWDGVEWVKQDGVVSKGKRQTIKLDGVGVTGNHPILTCLKTATWQSAQKVSSNRGTLSQALEIGSENLPFCAQRNTKALTARWSRVPVATAHISSLALIYTRENPLDVQPAAARRVLKLSSRNTLSTRVLLKTSTTVGDYSIGLAQLKDGAITQTRSNTVTTGGGVLKCALSGERKDPNSLNTLSLSTGGMCPSSRWTGLTTTVDMNPATYSSLVAQTTIKIKGPLKRCSLRLTGSAKKTENCANVYDILNAGPRNRFTIKTASGHLIVHNSAYQGGIGAWKQFGAEKHFESDEEIKRAIKAWRDESPMIVKFWYGLEEAARKAIQQPGMCFDYRDISYGVKDDVLYCQLPSGRKLSYHNPRLHTDVTPWGKEVLKITFMGFNSDYKKGPRGWMRMGTYGGKLAENVTQAVARDIMAYAMPHLDKAGYPIVLHVHDEVVSEVPEGSGSVGEFEKIMATMPPWAHDWPIRAAGGWRGKRYCK